MKIKIINKDNSTIADSNGWIYCDENIVYDQNQDETLDSATLRISHLSSKLNIEPFDNVIMWDETSRFFTYYFYMQVDTYNCREEGLDGTKYTYEISLFSETKDLETVILPNKIITQQTTNRSIYLQMTRYLETYGKKIRVNGAWVNKWSFNVERVSSKFANVCPEKQWNTPTLREVLTDLMMVNDCIPVLKNNVIDYIDLTETGDEVTYYNYVYESQSSADYISELKMNLVNVLQTSQDKVKNTVTTSEFIPFTSNSMVATSENIVLKTKYPILSIKHLWICCNVPEVLQQSTSYFLKYDLCSMLNPDTTISGYDDVASSFVKEKKEYDILPLKYRGWSINQAHAQGIAYVMAKEISKYQNYCVYYSRYGNTIEGWNVKTKPYVGTAFLSSEYTTLQYIQSLMIDWANKPTTITTTDGISYATGSNSYYRPYFQIEYETTQDAVFTASKSVYPSNDRVIMDNQTNSFVDAYSQGKLEYNKANRLGNKMYMINQRIEGSDTTNLLKICDTFRGCIIYKAQYQIYTDHVEVNAYACKDYILRDYWTGIKSKPRTYNNAMDEALQRHDLKKVYGELSFKQCNEYLQDTASSLAEIMDVSSWLTTPLKSNVALKPIRYAFVKTNAKPTDSNYLFALDCQGRMIGKSMVFTFGFTDNATVGKYVEDTSVSANGTPSGDLVTEYGGVPFDYAGYVDSNYEFDSITYRLMSDINFLGTEGTMPTTHKTLFDYGTSQKAYERIHQMPLINADTITSSGLFVYGRFDNYYKDNREIPTLSLQYELCTANRNIYITDDFVADEQGIRNAQNTATLYIYQGEFVYDKTDLTGLSITGYTLGFTDLNAYCTRITMVGSDIDYTKGYYFVRNNKVLMGCKLPENTNNIYLNVLKNRNKNVYNSSKEIVGSIEQ